MQGNVGYQDSEAATVPALLQKARGVIPNNLHLKDWATKQYRYAVKYRIIKRPDLCWRCSIVCKPHGHHTDYANPLDVMWLCYACHVEWHHWPLKPEKVTVEEKSECGACGLVHSW